MQIPSYLNRTKFSGIYVIENLINYKRYIGSSNSMYNRLHKHNSCLNSNVHQNPHLQNAWNKYGGNNFSSYVLEYCDPENLTRMEQKWIDMLEPEYNITLLVERNILSQESRDKISETLKEGYKNGTILPTRTKKILVYDLEGNYIETYPSIREASRQLNTHTSGIERVLRGTYYQSKGLQFRYENDYREVKKVEESRYRRRFDPAPEKPSELLETPEKDNQQPS